MLYIYIYIYIDIHTDRQANIHTCLHTYHMYI